MYTLRIACMLLALTLGACGVSATLEPNNAAQSNPAQTAQPITAQPAQTAQPITVQPAQTAQPITAQLATVQPATAVPDATSVAEGGPTASATSRVREGGARSADAAYKELVQRFGEDYASCEQAAAAQNSCQQPEVAVGATELKENVNIMLMLDSSGSMAEVIGGQPKLDSAKQALGDFVAKLPVQSNVALRVYGHTGSNSDADRPVSCQGTELLYPFQTLDKAQFDQAIQSFLPTGWTPIAASLEAAAQDFAQYDPATNTNVIYLVSDGIETCDGDPVAAARTLHEAEVKAVVNVIGFNLDAEAEQQMRAVAAAGGGEYLAANSYDELNRIFNERYSAAWSYWNCVYSQQWGNYNEVYNAEWSRWNCLYQKAWREWNNIYSEAYTRSNSGEWSDDVRDAVLEQAEEKRDSLLAEAEQRRDERLAQAEQERDSTLQEAESQRDNQLDDAEQDRDQGTTNQP
jgi:Ca-activated chloride channel homolog